MAKVSTLNDSCLLTIIKLKYKYCVAIVRSLIVIGDRDFKSHQNSCDSALFCEEPMHWFSSKTTYLCLGGNPGPHRLKDLCKITQHCGGSTVIRSLLSPVLFLPRAHEQILLFEVKIHHL
jgi:hypothetical protein